jgi:FixJ family two-component response regulator
MTERPIVIAVVDDEEPVLRALHRLLRSAGLQVRTFNGGQAFLNALADVDFDCVVLDLHMPTIDGLEVLSRLACQGRKPGVVVITGYDTPESRRRVMESGAAAYLRKPMDGPALLNAIASVVGRLPSSDPLRPLT